MLDRLWRVRCSSVNLPFALYRAIKPSYIAIFRAKNLNIGRISSPFQNNLALILVGCLGLIYIKGLSACDEKKDTSLIMA